MISSYQIHKLIVRYIDIFMRDKWDIGKTDILKHRILTNCDPILMKPRRQPMHFDVKIQDIIKNLEENHIIKKCGTPIVCVSKKDTDEIRMCLDFRLLNKNTVRPAFPMPNVDEMLDSLYGARNFRLLIWVMHTLSWNWMMNLRKKQHFQLGLLF